VKAISDKYALTEQGLEGMAGMSVALFGGGGLASVVPNSLVRYSSQMTNYGAFLADNLMILQRMMMRDGSDLSGFPGLAAGVWQPSAFVGISADTDVPDFAAQFVNTMLSVEVQRINYGEGLPATRACIAGQLKSINDLIGDSEPETFDADIFGADINALIEDLLVSVANDLVLVDMIQSSVEKLCMGRISIEEAVREI